MQVTGLWSRSIFDRGWRAAILKVASSTSYLEWFVKPGRRRDQFSRRSPYTHAAAFRCVFVGVRLVMQVIASFPRGLTVLGPEVRPSRRTQTPQMVLRFKSRRTFPGLCFLTVQVFRIVVEEL